MPVSLSSFARGLTAETAFDVLAVAKKLKAAGKDVVELQIGDSPFPSTASAIKAGHAAIDAGQTRYCPSLGLPEFRETIAKTVKAEFGIPAAAENVVVGPGRESRSSSSSAKLFLEPGDAVLVFSPRSRRTSRTSTAAARSRSTSRCGRRTASARTSRTIEKFLKTEPRAKAIFLNSPHNPTGGVATKDDLEAIADLVRGTEHRGLLATSRIATWSGKGGTTASSPSRG